MREYDYRWYLSCVVYSQLPSTHRILTRYIPKSVSNCICQSQHQTVTLGRVPIFVVNKVAKSRGVDDIKSQSDSVFLDIGTDSTDIDGLWDFDRGRWTCVLGGIQTGVKQSIHQRRLSQSRFPWKLAVNPPQTKQQTRDRVGRSTYLQP